MSKVYEFIWKARNRFGQKQKGKQLAENREQLENRLLHQGFQQIRIQRQFNFPQMPKSEEITQTLNQLGLLLNATLPLKQSLSVLLENTFNIYCYRWLQSLVQQIERGFSFSSALETEGKFLSVQEIQLIKIGEQSGKLAEMLTTIVQNRIKSEQLNKKVKKIMFYPTMILSVSLLLSVMLLIFIVPKFSELYQSKDKTLPFITELLFTLSAFLQQSIYPILFSIITSYIFIKIIAKRTKKLSNIKQRCISHIPVFSQIIKEQELLFFCQNSALMLKAQLRLEAILAGFIANNAGSPIFQKEIPLILERLKQGFRFSESLNSAVFPSEIIQMIAIGEKSGQLAQILSHISEIYRQKLDYRVDLLSQLIEPLLMVVMGLIVGTILISLYLPIFDMGAVIE